MIVLLEEKPTKAPIINGISPENEKYVIIIPAINKITPAEVPTGPNDLSSLLFVFILLLYHQASFWSLHQ